MAIWITKAIYITCTSETPNKADIYLATLAHNSRHSPAVLATRLFTRSARDPQAGQAGQQEHACLTAAPHGQARRHHPEVQELPRQVHLRAGPRERDCSDDLGSAEERAVERRGDNEAEDEAGAAEAREADDHRWGVRVAQLPPPP
ncbi:hypothetical protein Cni_G17559 [Canna indica]|uniref:Uncharacterized protein n=1 Tax=Canna indica TaxID=4628 RepID=A0AAQ3QGQ1_9LILI|nr:hypothetical protein Cni_G17559 [Canna indica]